MILTFRHSFYSAGAVVLLLCLTGVSVSAQEPTEGSRDRTVKQQTVGKVEATGSSTRASINASADNAKEIALSASSASKTAPVSFLAPRVKSTVPDVEPATATRPQGSSDKWEFMVAPYLWLAGISGEVGVRDLTTNFDASTSDILDDLNFGFMGTFEAKKNKFLIITDLLYVSLGECKELPGPLFSALKVDQKTFKLGSVVGYRVAEKDGAFLDAIVGIRFWHLSSGLELFPGLLAGRVEENSTNWADVIGGLRGQVHVSRRFSLIGRGDVGGGGTDYTYQLFGGVGIDVSKKASLFAGYRYLFLKYTRSDNLFDGALKGAVLGVEFRF